MGQEGNNTSSGSILIAEDEPINFMLLQKMLEKVPAKILWAKNGKEAVDRVRQDSTIQLILMDIRMPKMNGIEATEIIAKEFPEMPVVAVTAFNLSNERELCLAAGASGFLTKPVDPVKLIKTVKQHFNY